MATVAGCVVVCNFVIGRIQEVRRRKVEQEVATGQIRSSLPRVFAAIVRPHRECLARKRRILVKREANGTLVLTRWLGELSHFYKTTVLPELHAHFLTVGHPDLVVRLADEAAFLDWFLTSDPLHWRAEDFASGQPEPDMGPIEFEAWCRRALSRSDWNARIAPAGAAQAATILAERDGVTMAVQCRLSAQPVGTKAVQEVLTARRLYQRQIAVVVSNEGFMPLARSMAQAEGVCLLHHSELDGIAPEELVGAATPRRPAAFEVQVEEDALDASTRGKAVRVFGRR
ncbi:restriction endonuclease [Neotabrizicola shimadae]|uniref:Restriction endonuclease n=1 Tax=Neotabrizicola shimadae TaxID=2807096 RepID=A0A8G0ZUY3_9RHOB|nr:restriction endonuclease [Neotabrizicola shimadae]QYZ70939.1 restriction endonuclease [Neotabrizicola shimadae]